MNIKKIEMAWITVSDAQKAKKFYHDTLGLSLTSEAPEYGWAEFQGTEGGCGFGVGVSCGNNKPGHNAVVTFTVDDIVAAKQELEGKGVKFQGDIMEVPGHVKMATFHDEDNNEFQLVEKLD